MSTSSSPVRGRVLGLDGIRAFAVLVVFGYHLTPLVHGGWAGVDIFFVLSGFLITDLLLNEHRRLARIDLAAFWGRRAIRLLPALVTVLVLVLAIGWWRAGPGGFRNLYLGAAASLAYIANFRAVHFETMPLISHLWSLSLEEQFYLLWPPVLMLSLWRRVPLRRITFWLLTAAAASFVYCAVLSFRGVSQFRLADLPDTHSGGLLLGSALALWLAHNTVDAWYFRHIRSAAAACVFFVLPAFILLGSFQAGVPFRGGYLIVSVATVAVLLERLVCPTPLLSRLFEADWAVWIGQRSYEIYLIHYPVLIMLRRAADFTVIEQLGIGLTLTIALSALIHSLWMAPQRYLRAALNGSRQRRLKPPARHRRQAPVSHEPVFVPAQSTATSPISTGVHAHVGSKTKT